MGVDPSKLRAIDQRMLQSFLTKANSAVNLFGIQQPQGTGIKIIKFIINLFAIFRGQKFSTAEEAKT
jgi:hypothetical protein